MGIKSIIVIILICSFLIYAIDEVFNNEFYPKTNEIILTTKTITTSNPFCFLGITKYCNFEEIEVIKYIENTKLFNPFLKTINYIPKDLSRIYDFEDYALMQKYKKEELCADNLKTIEEIYFKTIEISFRDDLNCKESASLFKILYFNSPLLNSNKNYTLLKIYTYDNVYTAHRFNALRNENGYYILDPLSCTTGSFEYCVYTHTRRFYDDPTSILYRGRVYRVDEYI